MAGSELPFSASFSVLELRWTFQPEAPKSEVPPSVKDRQCSWRVSLSQEAHLSQLSYHCLLLVVWTKTCTFWGFWIVSFRSNLLFCSGKYIYIYIFITTSMIYWMMFLVSFARTVSPEPNNSWKGLSERGWLTIPECPGMKKIIS
jgi:hypothetical protein